MVTRIHRRRPSPPVSLRHGAVLGGAAMLFAGCFDLERTSGFGQGEIRVTVIDDAGDPIAGARVAIEGVNQAAQTDEDGLGVIGGLVVGDYAVRITVDDDGDGIAEAGAVRGEASVRLAPLTGIERLTSFELSTTPLAATSSVSGTVAGCADGEICRVVAFRHLTMGLPGARSREVALPIEGNTGVATDGSWRIDGLIPGTVTLLAMASPKAVATQPLQQLIAASRPTRFAVLDAEVGSAGVTLTVDTAVPASVTASLEVAAADVERVQGSVAWLVPGTVTDVTPGLDGLFAGLTAAQPTVDVEVPVSVFDVSADAAGVGGQLGLMAGVPGIGALLPVVLGLPGVPDTACVDVDADCLCDRLDPFPGCASNDPVECTPAAPIVCD